MKSNIWDVQENGGYGEFLSSIKHNFELEYGLSEEREEEIDHQLYLDKLNSGELIK